MLIAKEERRKGKREEWKEEKRDGRNEQEVDETWRKKSREGGRNGEASAHEQARALEFYRPAKASMD